MYTVCSPSLTAGLLAGSGHVTSGLMAIGKRRIKLVLRQPRQPLNKTGRAAPLALNIQSKYKNIPLQEIQLQLLPFSSTVFLKLSNSVKSFLCGCPDTWTHMVTGTQELI